MTEAPATFGKRFLRNAALLWVVFVAYGSLVPFTVRAAPRGFTWLFVEDWSSLAAAGGLDWTTNVLIGIPLAFCITGAVWLQEGKPARLRAVLTALFLCFATSIGVEFAQIWFGGRVPSLVDIVAQSVGAALGVVLWIMAGQRLLAMFATMGRGGEEALRAAMISVVGAYVLYALFPFDIILSAHEMLTHFTRPGTIGLLPDVETFGLRMLLLSSAKLAAFMPLGALVALGRSRFSRGGLGRAIALGFLVSAGLFIARTIFLSSGNDTVWSFMLRWAGAPAGYLAWRWLTSLGVDRVVSLLQWAAMLALIPYLLLLAGARGVLTYRPPTVAELSVILDQLSWLPFYYGFAASSTRAVSSFGALVLLFLPLGLFLKLIAPGIVSVPVAALSGAIVGVLIETGGLLVAGLRPDPSNPAIAALAVAFGAACVPWFIKSLRIHLLNTATKTSGRRISG